MFAYSVNVRDLHSCRHLHVKYFIVLRCRNMHEYETWSKVCSTDFLFLNKLKTLEVLKRTHAFLVKGMSILLTNRCCKIESLFKTWRESFNCSPLQHVLLVARKCLLNDNHKSSFCFPYNFTMLQNLYAFYERYPCYRTFYVNIVSYYTANCQLTFLHIFDNS